MLRRSNTTFTSPSNQGSERERLVADDEVEDLRGAAGSPGGDHQQICPLDLRGRLGWHQMPRVGPDLGSEADHRRMPGRGVRDVIGHCVREVQHVEDRRESGVEHAVDGNASLVQEVTTRLPGRV